MHCHFWTQIIRVATIMKVAVISKSCIHISRKYGHTAPPLINKLGILMCCVKVCACTVGLQKYFIYIMNNAINVLINK